MSPTHQISLLHPPGASVLKARIPVPTAASEYDEAIPPLFYSALHVRILVFHHEQHCDPDKEIDAVDPVSWHWVMFGTSASTGVLDIPAATVRLIPPQPHPATDDERADHGPNYAESKIWDHQEPYAILSRVATVKTFRGLGYGRMLVEAAFEWAGNNAGSMVPEAKPGSEWKGLVLAHAQAAVEGWYKGLGFETDVGMGLWLEEGIEHVAMWKRIELKP